MGRILALDYGEKRTGVAVTDVLQLIASGLTTVPTAELLPFLKTYAEAEPVERIVIGMAKRHDGTLSDIELPIRKFIAVLQRELPGIPVSRTDERFSSKMAVRTMIDGGVKKKRRQNKALVDEISATIILQSYLTMKQ